MSIVPNEILRHRSDYSDPDAVENRDRAIKLGFQVVERGAKMQAMREWMVKHGHWEQFCNENCDDPLSWFDESGKPI